MAKIVEEAIVITLSRISKGQSLPLLSNAELLATIESVVQELVDDGVVVEVTSASE